MEGPVYDLVAVGELVVDLVSTQMAPVLERAESFRRFLGGQAATVARNVSLLGGRTALVACVGADGLGLYLQQELSRAGVDTDYLQVNPRAPTTTVLIVRNAATPDFVIYRGADALLAPEDLPLDAIARSRAVHTSAFALSQEPARSAVLRAMTVGREAGALVSFDPTYYPSIWGDGAPLDVLPQACRLADVVKPSLDDCRRLWGPEADVAECAEHFLEWGARIVVVTHGARGSLLALSDGTRQEIRSHDVAVADVKGAGDAMWAGLLMGILDGLSPREAAEVGQAMAERKVATAEPLHEPLDRHQMYRDLFSKAPTSLEGERHKSGQEG